MLQVTGGEIGVLKLGKGVSTLQVRLLCCFVLLGVTTFGARQACASEQNEMEAILNHLRDAIGAMHTMTFKMDTSLKVPGEPEQRTVTEYWIKGSQFRMDNTALATPSGPRIHTIHAYNGDVYQSFCPEGKVRELRVFRNFDEPRKCYLNDRAPALALPYTLFLPNDRGLRPAAAHYSMMNEAETWDAVSRDVRVIGNEDFNGLACAVIELYFENPKTKGTANNDTFGFVVVN